MSLFPFVTDDVVSAVTPVVTPSSIKEYEIDFKTGRLTGKIVQGIDALCIWAYLALNTVRYKWVIYSWYYGAEYFNLIGYSYSAEYLKSEVRRYIEECLLENEHITGITNLDVSHIKDKLYIKFTLVTDVGSKEVEVNV